MKTQIDFNFYCWNKGDLIEFCYGKNAQVDSSIPIDCIPNIESVYGNSNAHHFFVMDYSDSVFGKLVNLKEKFFDVVAQKALSANCITVPEELLTPRP